MRCYRITELPCLAVYVNHLAAIESDEEDRSPGGDFSFSFLFFFLVNGGLGPLRGNRRRPDGVRRIVRAAGHSTGLGDDSTPSIVVDDEHRHFTPALLPTGSSSTREPPPPPPPPPQRQQQKCVANRSTYVDFVSLTGWRFFFVPVCVLTRGRFGLIQNAHFTIAPLPTPLSAHPPALAFDSSRNYRDPDRIDG